VVNKDFQNPRSAPALCRAGSSVRSPSGRRRPTGNGKTHFCYGSNESRHQTCKTSSRGSSRVCCLPPTRATNTAGRNLQPK